jgi:hypothetical protein
VIAEHGVPFYCKIDIEGNDRYCLMGLTTDTTPEYISIEMSHSDGGDDLKLLQGLGYDKFKLVSQVTRAQPIPLVTWLGHHLPGRLARAPRKLVRETIGVSRIGDWKFHYSSSGSFAEETPGPWRSYADVYAMWEKLRDIAARSKSKGLGEWFDFHATNARRT